MLGGYYAGMNICLGTTPTVQLTMVFERVAADEVNRAIQVIRGAAGKPVNVARVLHTLGDVAKVCVPLGGDTGKFLAEELSREGIEHDWVEAPNPTRTCVTVIDRNARSATELVQEHAAVSPEVVRGLLEKLEGYLAQTRCLILSGTLAPGTGDDFYARCCELAAKSGVPVILDGRGEPLARALQYRPLVVKPNRQELAAMMGRNLDDDAALRGAMKQLHERGAQFVIITMGRKGAIAFDGKAYWNIPAIEVEAISAIGSGDSFAAGLASGIGAGRDVIDACRLAAACAAANTLVAGAGFLKVDDVRRLEPLARVQRV
jgi:1-phosphofructokinase family hexose kinase